MDLSSLGTPRHPMTRVTGGFANRLWRLDTERGSFAVKQLTLVDRRTPYDAEAVFRLERAAFAAGIPMPEPVRADRETLVHRWVDGDEVAEEPVPPPFARAVGRILADLHALEVNWPYPPVEEPVARDWAELADRASATRQPWADALAAQVDTFTAIADHVADVERSGPIVLTHRDVQPWNLLDRGGTPVLLDWELAGRADLAGELGSTALSLAKGPGLDRIEPRVFRAVLEGYVDGGGVLPPPGPGWFAFLVGGWLGHTRWNVLRCLAGVEADTGPELALARESARAGIDGLPALFARLPELEALLL